jgi:hypothetical protein
MFAEAGEGRSPTALQVLQVLQESQSETAAVCERRRHGWLVSTEVEQDPTKWGGELGRGPMKRAPLALLC